MASLHHTHCAHLFFADAGIMLYLQMLVAHLYLQILVTRSGWRDRGGGGWGGDGDGRGSCGW